jgi:hypothetical protein
MMQWHAEYSCPQHPDPFDCLDNLIVHYPKDGKYGLIIHDGGESFVIIRHCPWCGNKLSPSKTSKSRKP